ncbi:hypothetical protein ABIE78_005277 [Sinorhizobium fredii]|jgi:hypothetical protein|uniref:Uncharacterized protein n=1 Tax=Sinorhizobium fredii (strain USDA 257) TaxID=1185652 RepID=I3WZA3_SINF2|nr:hypothetical protein [Sinorhizobium sp. BJ1]AFL48959.1 hypothetical protein USDA257_c03610 [Sinorhizobium fredii USDA 257]PDT85920.1 hypothetical protein CO676_03115 [Sinorhizobium sp. BJ1]
MDMMAMAVLFDMASRNRRREDQFEPRSKGRRETFGEHMLAALFRKPRPAERRDDCDGVPCIAP